MENCGTWEWRIGGTNRENQFLSQPRLIESPRKCDVLSFTFTWWSAIYLHFYAFSKDLQFIDGTLALQQVHCCSVWLLVTLCFFKVHSSGFVEEQDVRLGLGNWISVHGMLVFLYFPNTFWAKSREMLLLTVPAPDAQSRISKLESRGSMIFATTLIPSHHMF